MRPPLLNPLFAPVTSLSGVGPKQDKLFRYLLDRPETPRLIDLLFHLPSGVVDRRAQPKLRDAVPGNVVTVEVTIDRHRAPPRGRSRAPYLIYASDDTGDIVLTYFHAYANHLERSATSPACCKCSTAACRWSTRIASSMRRASRSCR
jgi:ATP-dependent DNA helicase RecG